MAIETRIRKEAYEGSADTYYVESRQVDKGYAGAWKQAQGPFFTEWEAQSARALYREAPKKTIEYIY